MAVDILALVKFHVQPTLSKDPLLEGDLPMLISVQTAQQGWAEPLTDPQATYIAALTLEALMPRLAQIYQDEVQERRAGVETTRLPNRAEFFKALRNVIATLKASAAQGAGVIESNPDVETAQLTNPWPGCGVARW